MDQKKEFYKLTNQKTHLYNSITLTVSFVGVESQIELMIRVNPGVASNRLIKNAIKDCNRN